MSMDVQTTRERICEIGRLLYSRNLTDASGGNISARSGKYICMTPRHTGSELHWNFEPHQVLVIDRQGIKVDGIGEFSREFKVHFQLYRDISNGNAVIHCHAPNVMVFCAAGIPLPPALEISLVFGEIGFSDFASTDSQELADSITAEIQKKPDALKELAAAVMSPWHGLFVLGRTLDAAFEAVERIELNARTLLMSSLLPGVDEKAAGLKKRIQQLKKESAKFNKPAD